MQPLTAHVVPASVQIKAEKLGEPRSEMGVAVGVNRKRADWGDTLTYDTFDRCADMPTQEGQGLVVRNPPLIEYSLVYTDAVNPAFRIDASIVEMLTRI